MGNRNAQRCDLKGENDIPTPCVQWGGVNDDNYMLVLVWCVAKN